MPGNASVRCATLCENGGVPGTADLFPSHRLSPAQFDEFCAGPLGADGIAALRSGQYSRRRLLLAALVAACGPDLEPAWRILAAVEERAPDVVEDVLMWPSVGVWLVRATRRRHGVPLDGPPPAVEVGFLRALAASAAVRAALPCTVEVPLLDGVLTLPTIGQARFDADAADLRVTPTEVLLRVARGSWFGLRGAAEFVPVRGSGPGLDVEIDDRTPYRWFSAPEPPRPLGEDEFAAWRADLRGAWEVLTRWHPGFAAELAAGLVSVAPLAPGSRVVGASASAAFGGAALSAADSPATLAATLVHELQHTKLNALLDLVVLHTRDDAELTYAPWRDDPRPLTGLLHGIYAFTSTVEFWHTQRKHVPEDARQLADFSFVHRRMQVEAAIEGLVSAPDLTGFGVGLVDGAARRLSRCPLDDVPAETIERAKAMILDHRASWRP